MGDTGNESGGDIVHYDGRWQLGSNDGAVNTRSRHTRHEVGTYGVFAKIIGRLHVVHGRRDRVGRICILSWAMTLGLGEIRVARRGHVGCHGSVVGRE